MNTRIFAQVFLGSVLLLVASTGAGFAQSPVLLQVDLGYGHFDMSTLNQLIEDYNEQDLGEPIADLKEGSHVAVRAGLALPSGDTVGIGYARYFARLELAGGDKIADLPSDNVFAFYQLRTALGDNYTIGFSVDVGVGFTDPVEVRLEDEVILESPSTEPPSFDRESGLYYAGSLFLERSITDKVAVVLSGGYGQLKLRETARVDYIGPFFRLGLKIGG